MLQPALISFIALVLLTVALFVAVRKKWIKDDTLNSLATVATIIAGLASILNFILFVDFGDDPGPTPTVDAAAPTITATPTSTPTSTPTPTPQPTPPIVYDWTHQDDFSIASGWDVLSDSLGTTYYEQGEYVVKTKRGNVLYVGRWKDLGQNIENGTIQVRIQRPASSEASDAAGIVFGWRDDLEGNSYALTIDKQGACYFREQSYGGWKQKSSGTAEQFSPDLESHKLTVVIRDNRAYGYVDDEFCTDLELVAYSQGYVGVVAHSTIEQIEGGSAHFDDFMVAVE